MSLILGINSAHADTAAAIIKDGEIICAIEEERFTRNKHECGFPINAINACCKEAGCGLEDLDFIGVNSKASNKIRKLKFMMSSGAGLEYLQKKFRYVIKEKRC